MNSRISLVLLSLLSIALIAVVTLMVKAGGDAIRETKDVSEPAVRALQGTAAVQARCRACHEDVCKEFATAPHGRTLSLADDKSILDRFAGRSFDFPSGGAKVTFSNRNNQLWMQSDQYPEPLHVKWIFGSGEHAMTPVSLLENSSGEMELIEGSVSWFSSGNLGLTPGADASGAPGLGSLGAVKDHYTSLECFGCHVTELPYHDGKIDESRIVRGVTCDRCHPGSDEHIESVENGLGPRIEKWSALSPLESINRCGECHRRADQLTKSELSPDRNVLVRFASVGLVMSACFKGQQTPDQKSTNSRLDCLTCHDPHKQAETSSEYYTQKCVQCHQADGTHAATCSSAMTSRECLTCHMPAVNVTDQLKLTDHWIRVRTQPDPASTQTPAP